MLDIKNIGMNYSIDDRDFVIRDISLSLQDGECLAVVGGSGCGKTTFLNIIGGLLVPTEGYVRFDGKEIGERDDIAMILQDYGLFPWKTVWQNMMLPMILKHRKDASDQCLNMLRKLELEKVKDQYPSRLSGGQKQRTAIGRAVLSFPKMILMDEPFSALDLDLRKRLNRELKTYFSENKVTTIIVTHSVEEALYWGDKIMVLTDGKSYKLIENDKCDGLDKSTTLKTRIRAYITGGYADA